MLPKTCENRLRSMIVKDKEEAPKNLNKVLKSEILFVLKNYFDVTAEDVSLDVSVSETGRYVVNISAESRSLRVAHIF